jgi:SAM-dependent methyltransferase
VEPDVVASLLALNYQFYQTFATQFSATRMRLQPGVRRLLEKLDPEANILDLGCGNGELARQLARHQHRGLYIGLDFSHQLLEEAQKVPLSPLRAAFLAVDLTQAGWTAAVRSLCLSEFAIPEVKFHIVLAFAVLHHIPGEPLRRQIIQEARRIMAPNGYFIHSEWQFLNSPRWRARIQPWEQIGLNRQQVDPGDYLLDWRHGGYGLRYVHLFSEGELRVLAKQTGFSIEETFYSDGAEGNLALYQVWKMR